MPTENDWWLVLNLKKNLNTHTRTHAHTHTHTHTHTHNLPIFHYLCESNQHCPSLHEKYQEKMLKGPLTCDLEGHEYMSAINTHFSVSQEANICLVLHKPDVQQYLWLQGKAFLIDTAWSKENYLEIFIVLLSDFIVLFWNLLHKVIILGCIQQWWTLKPHSQ